MDKHVLNYLAVPGTTLDGFRVDYGVGMEALCVGGVVNRWAFLRSVPAGSKRVV